MRRIPIEWRRSSSPSGEWASFGSSTTNGGPVNTLCNLPVEGFCHLERSQEGTCQWQMKDFFSRCGFEISSNARLRVSVCFHCDDAICWRWTPHPHPTSSLPLSLSFTLTALPVYYLDTGTLSCYPSPFCSMSHSSTLTRLKTGLLNPFRISGRIYLMARCWKERPEWPCSTILWIWCRFCLFGFFIFNVWWHDVSIDQMEPIDIDLVCCLMRTKMINCVVCNMGPRAVKGRLNVIFSPWTSPCLA